MAQRKRGRQKKESLIVYMHLNWEGITFSTLCYFAKYDKICVPAEVYILQNIMTRGGKWLPWKKMKIEKKMKNTTKKGKGGKKKMKWRKEKEGEWQFLTHTFVIIVVYFISLWHFIISYNCLSHQLRQKWLLGKKYEKWGCGENDKMWEQG